MFKLLTETGKEEVRREYVVRRTVVMLAALGFVLVVGIVSLFPSYVLSKVRHQEVLEQSESVIAQKNSESESLKLWLAETNKTLDLVAPALDKDRPFEIFTNLIELKSSAIKITSFAWHKGEKDAVVKLVVEGTSRDRKSLLDFQSALEKSGKFTNVELPISNLAKDKDLPFQLTLTPKSS